MADDDKYTCWCGAVGTYEELFAPLGPLPSAACGGSGYIQCECGGDQCVCHWHGEAECPGCEDCELDDDDYDAWEEDL